MDFIQVMLVMEKKGYKIDFGNYKQNSQVNEEVVLLRFCMFVVDLYEDTHNDMGNGFQSLPKLIMLY